MLSGEWSIFAAHTDQGNLLSRDLLTNQDFAAEFRNGTTGYPGQRFVLYESPGNKYNVVFQPFGLDPGQVGVLVELRLAGNTYTPVLPWTLYDYDCAGPVACTFGLVKAGSRYSLFINGSLAGEFTDSIWSGNTRLGLGAYAGPVTYDRFTLETVPIPEPGILALLTFGLSGLGGATRVRRGRARRSAGSRLGERGEAEPRRILALSRRSCRIEK